MVIMNSNSESIPTFVIKAAAAASLGGILFGYDMGVISGALPQLTVAFDLSEAKQEMVVSFLYIGCCIGATGGGYLCDKLGRKSMILVTDLVFVVGAFVLFWASSLSAVLAGRVLIGCAVAISGIADVAYLHEISPRRYRGSIVSCNEACISLGFMISYLVSYGISTHIPNDGWRWMFFVGSGIAIMQFAGMLCMPESPVWLKRKGKVEAAQSVLDQIHSSRGNLGTQTPDTGSPVKLSPQRSYSSFGVEQQAIPNKTSYGPNESGLQTIRVYHRQIIITIFLSTMQHWCGHTNVLNFAPEIFAQIGFDSEEGRLLSTSLVGVVKFATVCLAIKKVESCGRRYLLLMGMCVIAFSLFMLSLVCALDNRENVSIVGKIGATFAIFGVAGGYSFSFGPLVWLIVSELFPSDIRGRALGGSAIVSYASAALVSYTFFTGQEVYGLYIPFAIYCALTVLSIIFAYTFIPDTAKKTPEEIHAELEHRWGGTRQKVSLEEFELADDNKIV